MSSKDKKIEAPSDKEGKKHLDGESSKKPPALKATGRDKATPKSEEEEQEERDAYQMPIGMEMPNFKWLRKTIKEWWSIKQFKLSLSLKFLLKMSFVK